MSEVCQELQTEIYEDRGVSGQVTAANSGKVQQKTAKPVQKRILQLVKEYHELHRKASQQELDANKERLATALADKDSPAQWHHLEIPAICSAQSQGKACPEKQRQAGQGNRRVQIKVQTSLQNTIVVSARSIPKHTRVPPCKSWSYLMQNALAQEVGGRVFYTDGPTGETIPASDSEDEDRKGETHLEGLHRECMEWIMCRLAEEHGSGPDVVEALANRFDAANGVIEARLKSLLGKPIQQTHTLVSLETELEKCSENFCRRCRIYNCLTHQGPNIRPHMRPAAPAQSGPMQCGVDCWQAQLANGGDTLHKQLTLGKDDGAGADELAAAPLRRRQRRRTAVAALAREADQEDLTLSADMDAQVSAQDGSGATDWTDCEIALLQYGLCLYKNDCCRTARLIGTRKCYEVYTKQSNMPSAPASPVRSPALEPARRMGSKRKPMAPQRRKNATTVVTKRHKHDLAKPWPAYTPCQCAGPCTTDCSCLVSKNFCEKFCACGPDCSIRFVGCDCKSGCRTKACPCFAAGHECDTDLCTGCARGALLNECGGSLPCNNMKLRFRQHKRVAMGKSDVQGWGSFLLEGACKGELLGEYTGELVTQEEADRRGKGYDRDDNSYLFNLNEDWVIDARRRGNKLRFANHSTDPNCMAKILMVDGDHRVGIYARKDIAPCTELFYDYCYQRDHAPAWATHCNRALV